MKLKPTTALCAAALLGATLGAQADDAPTYGKHLTSTAAVAKSRPGSFDVYIDKPTGFAFVNTPGGWKFTRKVQDDSKVVVATKPDQVAKF